MGKIVPLDMLAQMPLQFVRRLRDIRIKQIEEANKEQEMNIQNNNGTKSIGNIDHAMFNGTAMDDLIDELT